MLDKSKQELQSRADLLIIADLIGKNTSVLDLGCGNGNLLHILKSEKNIYACGLEISQDKILECVSKGVPVIHSDLNDGLSEFSDDSFDFVVLSQTIQAVQRPDNLLEDMIRVGKKGIVSFLNIGYFPSRFQLTFSGKMPITNDLPDQWYNTQNIHLATIRDFRNLCREKGFKITKEIPFGGNWNILAKCCPNMFAPTCVFIIEK
jgi:methionine biosynthesis protein MetW